MRMKLQNDTPSFNKTKFKDIYIGGLFINFLDDVVMKIADCSRDGELVNAIYVDTGYVAKYNDNDEVVEVSGTLHYSYDYDK